MARAHTINTPRGNKRRRVYTAVGYVRRSTDRQEQSIPDQRQAIEHYCEQQNLRLLRFYIDDAISGTSTLQRHAFQSMIEAASSSSCEFAFVIVYDVKRFGRVDNDEAGYYRHILRSNGVDIIYVSENFNGDGTDDLLRPVKQWQAREESKDLAKVTIRGLLSKATPAPGIPGSIHGSSAPTSSGVTVPIRGRSAPAASGGGSSGGGGWMGGAPPLGYDLQYESQAGQFLFYLRYMRDGSKQMFDERWDLVRTLQRGETVAVSRKDRCLLAPSEASRVKVVRRIFHMYVEEERGFAAITDVLNRDGVPTSRAAGWAAKYTGKWATSTVRSILTNPAYVGDIVWNRRTDARFFCIRDGRAVERKGVGLRRLEFNDESDWIVIPNTHEPLISRRTFELAKQRIRANQRSGAGRSTPGPGTASGNPGSIHGSSAPTSSGVTVPISGGSAPGASGGSGGGGPRAQFLLSGLGRCSRCGNRYEGYSRYPRRKDGPRGKTLHYACGGYIRQGRSTCTLGAIGRDLVESVVVDAIVRFYARYAGIEGLKHLSSAAREHLGGEHERVMTQHNEFEAEIDSIDQRIGELIDSITPTNRRLIDKRLDALTHQQQDIEAQLESLRHLALTSEQLDDLVGEIHGFVSGLEVTLCDRAADERQAAIRRCVRGIVFDRESSEVRIELRHVPTATHGQFEAATRTVIASLESDRQEN